MRNLIRRLWLALAAVALVCASARAQMIAYGVTTSDSLYRIDLSTGAVTTVGSMGVSNMIEGLAVAPNGQLYGTDTQGQLYAIDATTGAGTLLFSLGTGNIEGLDFLGHTLVAATFSATPSRLFSIDLSSGAMTDFVTIATGLNASTNRALAFLDTDTAFVSNDAGGSLAGLFRIDLSTGTSTLVGNLSVSSGQLASMDIAADGNLYGLDYSGHIFRISQTDGAITTVANTTSAYWLDIAIVTVPEPSTYALFALGLALVCWVRRRR